jgi:hypothetical protein
MPKCLKKLNNYLINLRELLEMLLFNKLAAECQNCLKCLYLCTLLEIRTLCGTSKMQNCSDGQEILANQSS